MNELDALDKLGDVPPPTAQAEAGARAALFGAVAREHGEPVQRYTRSGRPAGLVRLGAAACVAAAMVAAGAVVLTRSPSTPRYHLGPLRAVTTQPHVTTVAPQRGTVTVVMAGYRFALPAGYSAVDHACQPMPVPPPGIPLTVIGGLSAAASAAGGCVQAELAAGAGVVPGAAQPVNVGAYQGYVLSTGTDSEVLYVAIPAADGHHYLVVSAVDLPPAELIAVVAAALLTSSGTTTSTCNGGCG